MKSYTEGSSKYQTHLNARLFSIQYSDGKNNCILKQYLNLLHFGCHFIQNIEIPNSNWTCFDHWKTKLANFGK